MAERQEWFVDEEGNLTSPAEADGDGIAPSTDEFGRDDPASLERERRRQEREAKRKARKKKARHVRHKKHRGATKHRRHRRHRRR